MGYENEQQDKADEEDEDAPLRRGRGAERGVGEEGEKYMLLN